MKTKQKDRTCQCGHLFSWHYNGEAILHGFGIVADRTRTGYCQHHCGCQKFEDPE